MIKYLMHENGNGPEKIDVIDEPNPFGVAVIFGSGHKVYYRDREKLMHYCSDTYEEAWQMKKQILEAHVEFFKSNFEHYTHLLESDFPC